MPFTENDIANLTKYLASFSESEKGRMGNTLYKQLVDDVRNRRSPGYDGLTEAYVL